MACKLAAQVLIPHAADGPLPTMTLIDTQIQQIPQAPEQNAASETSGSVFEHPFDVITPDKISLPIVLNSPHSGRSYPAEFLAASALDALSIRRSEDSFVDELFEGAVALGAPLLRAHFPRAYLDVNREPFELDPTMFDDSLPAHVNTTSLRVSGGLGTIAKIVGDGSEIYRQKLSYKDANRRIETLYKPYHARLSTLLKQAFDHHRCAVLIDCHSMPSIGGLLDQDAGADRPEIVLGDRYGTACAPILMHTAEQTLRGLGYKVARNNPYAGGFNTEQYGRPAHGRHALQIELNRSLYMDEAMVERSGGLTTVKQHMTELVAALAEIDHRYLKSPV